MLRNSILTQTSHARSPASQSAVMLCPPVAN